MSLTIVNVDPGERVGGNEVLLTGDDQQLSTDATQQFNSITLRSATGNDVIWLLTTDGHVSCGFLNAEDAVTIGVKSPSVIWVQGTEDQKLYWFGNTTR